MISFTCDFTGSCRDTLHYTLTKLISKVRHGITERKRLNIRKVYCNLLFIQWRATLSSITTVSYAHTTNRCRCSMIREGSCPFPPMNWKQRDRRPSCKMLNPLRRRPSSQSGKDLVLPPVISTITEGIAELADRTGISCCTQKISGMNVIRLTIKYFLYKF